MSIWEPDPVRVLVVDDEPRLQRLLTRAVRELGFDALALGSAEQALRHLDQTPEPIVIVDLNLPGMGGLELFEQVRRRWPATQVIVLTGFGDLEAAQRAIRLEAADFLIKPYQLGELERALSRARQRLSARTDEPEAAPAMETSARRDEPGSLEAVERRHILEALARHDGDRKAVARELGISLRTLYYRLAHYRQQGDPL